MSGHMETATDLADFLLARIADDEAVARNALHADAKQPGVWITEGHNSDYYSGPNLCHIAEDRRGHYWSVAHEVFIPNAEHIARHDPARVLAECEAKRRIVEMWTDPDTAGPDDAEQSWAEAIDASLRLLATPYRDHPDYQQEWGQA